MRRMHAMRQTRQKLTSALYAAHQLVDTLNIVVQLLIGALIAALIDIRFITLAQQGQTINVPYGALYLLPYGATYGAVLMVAIPVVVTLGWVVVATVALSIALRQAESQAERRSDQPPEVGAEVRAEAGASD